MAGHEGSDSLHQPHIKSRLERIPRHGTDVSVYPNTNVTAAAPTRRVSGSVYPLGLRTVLEGPRESDGARDSSALSPLRLSLVTME